MRISLGLLQQHRELAVAIGNFDGVHLGHRHVLAKLTASAQKLSVPAAVLTFEPHPLSVLRPKDTLTRIDSLRSKARKLAAAGIERLIVMRFTESFASMTAPEFADMLAAKLRVKHVVVGKDFRFGAGRKGDIDDLRRFGAQRYTVDAAEDLCEDGIRISSGVVRMLLASGDFSRTAEVLGERYSIEGRVIHGSRMGRKLGVPTANIRWPGTPAIRGVYAAAASTADGKSHLAALSIGTREAAGGHALAIEAHLLDFDGDLYGQQLKIEPRKFLREQRNYPTLDALKEAMDSDIAACRSEPKG